MKRKKVQKREEYKKWHGNEEQMNISVYHMLQSCGVQIGSYLKTEVTNEIHLSGLNWTIIND